MTDMQARRVIGGMTYSTRTSTLLATAHSEGDNQQTAWDGALYRTRMGAYFEVSREEQHWHDKRAGEWKTKIVVDVTPLDHAAAVQWCEDNKAEILVEFFDLPEEASDGKLEAPTFLLRMTDVLKRRIEAKAKEAGTSMTAYMIACLEGCLERSEARS
jgi:hypothetical protein